MKTKAPNPISKLSPDTLPFITAYFEYGYLKQLYRQGWLRKNIPEERCESVAEHTFGVAVIGMLLAEAHFPDFDVLKILKMSLIHDFGEVYAGDFTPEDDIPAEQKHELEAESIARILNRLPLGEDYLRLWAEFENGISPEAQFVRQLDKLEMALQSSVYEHQGFDNLADFYLSASKSISSPEIKAILDELQTLAEKPKITFQPNS